MNRKSGGNKVTLDNRFLDALEKYKAYENITWDELSKGITTNSKYILSIRRQIQRNHQATAKKDLIEAFCNRIGVSLKDIVVNPQNWRANEAASKAIKFKTKKPKDHQEMCFIGADTLTITTLAKAFCELNVSEEIPIVVKGRDNQHNLDNVEFLGHITGAKLDGYQRTIYMTGKSIHSDEPEPIDIGGDNASIERIASSYICMHIPTEILSEVAGKTINNGSAIPFGLNIETLDTQNLESMIKLFLDNHAITHAIDLAKQIRTPRSVELLMTALDRNYSKEIKRSDHGRIQSVL